MDFSIKFRFEMENSEKYGEKSVEGQLSLQNVFLIFMAIKLLTRREICLICVLFTGH